MVHTGEVQGSIPCASTIQSPVKSGLFAFLDQGLFGSCGTFGQNQAATGGGKSGDFVQEMFFRFALRPETAASRSQLLAWTGHFNFNFVFKRFPVPGDEAPVVTLQYV